MEEIKGTDRLTIDMNTKETVDVFDTINRVVELLESIGINVTVTRWNFNHEDLAEKYGEVERKDKKVEDIKTPTLQYLLDMDRNILYRAIKEDELSEKVLGCTGKTVKVESIEMDCLLVDGKYFQIVGGMDGLVVLQPIPNEVQKVREIIERLHAEESDRYNRTTCSGYLYEGLVKGRFTVDEFLEDCKKDCVDYGCKFYQAIKRELRGEDRVVR